MYLLAPFLAVVPAFLIFMMVPWGRPFMIGDNEVALQGADLNIGLLFILAMSSLAVYSVVLAGWSSGSKYPLLGGVRATAQAISYEAALGLSIVAVVMWSASAGESGGGSLSLAEIVARQGGTLDEVIPQLGFITQFIPRWNVFLMRIFGAGRVTGLLRKLGIESLLVTGVDLFRFEHGLFLKPGQSQS